MKSVKKGDDDLACLALPHLTWSYPRKLVRDASKGCHLVDERQPVRRKPGIQRANKGVDNTRTLTSKNNVDTDFDCTTRVAMRGTNAPMVTMARPDLQWSAEEWKCLGFL
eukprot:jgi/Tetstr1/447687/TSEL_035045.t1